jgi:nucleotide sugar dehydrogenase
VSDKEGIDRFVARHAGKKVVAVQGLGFVGSVMALVVANALTEEYAVIGVDLPGEATYSKIKAINEGEFPVSSADKKVDEFYQNALRKGNLFATFDPCAYSVADIIIVDINLDVKKTSDRNNSLLDYDVDMDGFKSAMQTVAGNTRKNALVLIETTVPPGTCEKIVVPIFRKAYKDRGLAEEFMIGHSYERVMPGAAYIDSIQNFYRVYSGIDEKSADATETFLRSIIHVDKFPLTRLHSTTASEMSKVLENSFRAMNIAFIQEWSLFAEEAGVNLYEVIDAIRMRPTHRNIMSPGLGVGGYCLPKDPLLASWSRQHLYNAREGLTQSENAVSLNDQMPLHTFEAIQRKIGSVKGRRIGMLGASYLSNVGDTRYSPAGFLYDLFTAAGAEVVVTDMFVGYWHEKNMATLDLEDFLQRQPEVLVYCTRHDYFKASASIEQFLNGSSGLTIVDAVGMLDQNEVDRRRKKHQIIVIGRGDI